MKPVLKLLLILIAAALVLSVLSKPDHESQGTHYGLNSSAEFFEKAYKNVDPEKTQDKISGIIVNHHLLAPHLIAREFALVETQKPITVVLISPNHFFRGEGRVITSQYDWQTPYGVLKTDQGLVEKLKTVGANVDETPFGQEHGASGIVGFVKKSIPNAKFAAILVKDMAADEQVDNFARELARILPSDALVIGSFDFSHYLTSSAADFHDAQALAVINNFDYERIKLLDIDSAPGLRLMLKYLEARGDKKFVLNSHSNSSKITGNFNFIETTSYINGYFTKGENPRNENQTVLYSNLDKGLDYEKTERLFKYNDTVTTVPDESLKFLNFKNHQVAVGLIKNQEKVTEIYLFPLKIAGNKVTLLPFDESAKILAQIASQTEVSEEIKKQIKAGHIRIK